MSDILLQSKHIVITGGTSGIGYRFVQYLHANNTVTVIGRPSPRLEALDSRFSGIRVHTADLSQTDSVIEAADRIVKTGEAVDILINNAAVQHTPGFLDDDFRVETIQREINTNLTAPAILIALLLPALLKSKGAVVLNINSGLGLVPKTGSAVYCATKGGLNILSQSLRNQFDGTDIRVMQAFLPLVDTEMTKGRGSGKISALAAAEQILARLSGTADDIDIGKVRFLRPLMRLSPSMARNIMRKGG